MRMREEIGRGKKSDAGRNRTREEIGDGKKSETDVWRQRGGLFRARGWGKRQIILGGRKSCVIFAYYELN